MLFKCICGFFLLSSSFIGYFFFYIYEFLGCLFVFVDFLLI